MDAKLKEDLFRRYVTALERRLEEEHAWIGGAPDADKGRHKDSEALLSTATALLGAYQPDPGQRFRMVPFYEVVENSLRCHRGGNLKSLEKAFHTLETICTNLLLFPWKKEFRCIKVNKMDNARQKLIFFKEGKIILAPLSCTLLPQDSIYHRAHGFNLKVMEIIPEKKQHDSF